MSDEEEARFTVQQAEQLAQPLQQPKPDTNTKLTEATPELLNSDETHQPGDWYPGMPSPNPNGRPLKERSFTAILESKADKESIATELLSIAADQSLSAATRLEAIKYIYARIEGNPLTAIRHQVEGQVSSLIFLHPGRPAELNESTEPTLPEAQTTEETDQ